MVDFKMKGEGLLRNNDGITMVELIIVMGLLAIILPFGWNYVNSGIEDNVTLNNKMMVQNSVNALMNQLQRDIQEARYPINPNVTEYIDVTNDGFLICKPNGTDDTGNIVYQSVLYKFDDDENKVIVEFGLKLDSPGPGETDYDIIDDNATKGEYNYIEEFSLTKIDNNGIKVYIRGQIDDKSGYTLTNTYYTRNTLF